jgi:protein-tyrosine phosphatase
MTAVLDVLDEALSQDHKIYLHCVGGIGRTGMAVGCYLVRHGRSGQEALDELARLYRSAGQSAFYAVSPENGRQVTFIRDWQG